MLRKLAVVVFLGTSLLAGAWLLVHAGKARTHPTPPDKNEPPKVVTADAPPTAPLASVPLPHSRPPLAEPHRDIDRHALQASREAEQSIDSLARYLVGPARNEREKVRALFRWITDRIAYDVDAYYGVAEGDDTPAGVLARRKAVCEGYANLFKELCDRAGIEAVVIHGYGKGLGAVPGEDVAALNHAWNAVKIDGAWHLLDVCWSAGFVERKQFYKEFMESYYLPLPEQMILDHFPTDPAWQLLRPPVSAQDVSELLKLEKRMRPLVLLHREIVEKLRDQTFRGFVGLIDVGESRYLVRKAPLSKQLRAGSRQTFQIESAAFVDVAVLTGGKYRVLTRKGDLFDGDVTLEKGMVLVSVKLANQKNDSYWPLMEYVAE
jgi:hypothetical protein